MKSGKKRPRHIGKKFVWLVVDFDRGDKIDYEYRKNREMGEKLRSINVIMPETRLEKKLCPYCSSGAGGKKEIYDSLEDAMSIVETIKKERGTLLKIYKCPYKTGWHLTKDNAADGAGNFTRKLLRDNDIPLLSAYDSRVKWEYVEERSVDKSNADPQKNTPPPAKPEKPIVRIEAEEGRKNILLKGRVVEIVKNISIENIFKINLDNLFSASLAKDFLDGEYRQITVHAGHNGADRIDSYTVLVKKAFMLEHNIKKDDTVNIVISGKRVNNKTVWLCAGTGQCP